MAASAALPVSLFALLREHVGDRLPLLRCTKATLVHLSHTLEDLVLTERLPALLFTGFQESSHWREETERYRALADVVQQVCIFAGGQLPPESSARELHVTLGGDDPLRQEWFLAVLCPTFAVVLCGQDRQVPTEEEATRQFDTLWSFQPELIAQVLDRLEQVVGTYRPERLDALQEARRRYPLTAPNPDLITRFTAELIRFEEELHHRLVATRRQLEQQIRWRETLLSLLVHDLSTPLQSLELILEMLRTPGELSEAERQEMAELGLNNVHRLSAEVRLILDTNQLAEGGLGLRITRLDSAAWVETALLPVRIQAQRANIQLIVEVRVATFWADSSLMSRALQNLVGNGIKFAQPGGTVHVTLAAAPQRGMVELRVRDNGRGIRADDLPLLFNRYEQGRQKDRRGYGLGLYFCRLVAEAHGGSIRVDSALGVGTSFTLTVPARPPLRML